jgi:hypothetical protein
MSRDGACKGALHIPYDMRFRADRPMPPVIAAPSCGGFRVMVSWSRECRGCLLAATGGLCGGECGRKAGGCQLPLRRVRVANGGTCSREPTNAVLNTRRAARRRCFTMWALLLTAYRGYQAYDAGARQIVPPTTWNPRYHPVWVHDARAPGVRLLAATRLSGKLRCAT